MKCRNIWTINNRKTTITEICATAWAVSVNWPPQRCHNKVPGLYWHQLYNCLKNHWLSLKLLCPFLVARTSRLVVLKAKLICFYWTNFSQTSSGVFMFSEKLIGSRTWTSVSESAQINLSGLWWQLFFIALNRITKQTEAKTSGRVRTLQTSLYKPKKP